MDGLQKHLSHLFCCMPVLCRNDANSRVHIKTAPHSSSESQTDDARALHHIFSSSSSIRGYQTAATKPGYNPPSRPSLDRDFQFGSQLQRPRKQPQGRIEKLGEHIKQKLSESRLSKSSSKHDLEETDLGLKTIKSPPAAEVDLILGISHSSTGLNELLASRNASQGGYDSDAQTIRTPLVRSNAGTLKVSAGFVRQTLGTIEHDENLEDPSKTFMNLSVDSQDHLTTSSTHEKEMSSPFPSTPGKISFSAALQMELNESPSDALKRLSIGIANGTIRMPNTPELRATRMPSVNEIEKGWRLAAPRRSSSLKVNDEDTQQKLKRLSDRVGSLKRQSLAGVDPDNKRSSLISELDPALIEYMSRYAECISSDEPLKEGSKLPVADHHVGSQSPPELRDVQHSEHVDAQSETGTDKESIHLYNMRISQRLGRITSQGASNCSLAVVDVNKSLRPSTSGVSRYPQFIASEHNRRPSDPQTRRLFETSGTDRRMQNSTWLTVTTMPSSGVSTTGLQAPRDDASSFYASDNGLRSAAISPTSSRRNSLKNPNSIAIAGRSVSNTLPDRQLNRSVGQLSTALESAWLSQRSPQRDQSSEESWMVTGLTAARGRSASMPHKDFRQPDSPTPFSKRHRELAKSAESMSEISLERVMDRRNEAITEITQQGLDDRRNETFSEADNSLLRIPGAELQRYGENSQILSVNYNPNRQIIRRFANSGADVAPRQPIHESTTSVWERAFKHARDGSNHDPTGNFLTSPVFDHHGRRRSSKTRISQGDASRRLSSRSLSPVGRIRSDSAEPSRRQTTPVDLDLHQQLCCAAKTPLPVTSVKTMDANPPGGNVHSQTLKEKSKPRKKSLLDMRRLTSARQSVRQDQNAEGSTSMRELLGAWARFPSHTRNERNGTATMQDSVKTHDYQPAAPTQVASSRITPPVAGSTTPTPFLLLTRRVHKGLNKAKSKSMTLTSGTTDLMTPAERAKRNRKGFKGGWRKLYRNSSSELRKHIIAYGHRSSFSLGDAPDYPELEFLPGEGSFNESRVQRWRSEVDSDTKALRVPTHEDSVAKDIQHSDETKFDRGAQSRAKRVGASYWANYYASCVGSLSALRSDPDTGDVRSMSIKDEIAESATNAVRGRDELIEQRERLESGAEAITNPTSLAVESQEIG